MTTATALLSRLAEQGVRLSVDGDALHVDAPRGLLTDELRGELAANKPALLDELRLLPGVDLSDGCENHAVSADDIVDWWRVAAERNAAVAMCVCCFGPATAEFVEVTTGGHIGITQRCRYCEPIGS